MRDFILTRSTAGDSASERELSAQLCELPMLGPRQSVWPQLEAQLRQRGMLRQRRNYWRPALAAAAALLLSVPLLRGVMPDTAKPAASQSATTAPSTAAAMTPTAPATDWSARSQILEAALRQRTSDAAPLDATSAYAAAQLEDLIGMTDVALDQSRDPRESDLLWQRRLVLMQRLANVRSAGLIAVGPDSVAAVSDATYRID